MTRRPTTRDAHSKMTAAQFKAWRRRLSMSQDDAGHALGVTRRSLQAWEVGTKPIPLVVALACAAYEHGFTDYPGAEAAPPAPRARARTAP